APLLPELLGGSADLAGSNLTTWSGSRALTGEHGGNYIHYGVREFGMAAVMRIRSVFVLTHDSVGIGEDGPTHQPVEHVASLRLIPHMDVWRPCDAEESVAAWAAALARHDGPTCLVLSRQSLPFQAKAPECDIARGGYILVEPEAAPRAMILATGSEVALAVDAQKSLALSGIPVR